MSPLLIVFLTLFIAALALALANMRHLAPAPTLTPPPGEAPRPPGAPAPLAMTARERPQRPLARSGKATTPAPAPETGVVAGFANPEARDRYIAARLPGIARNGADLMKFERVVRAARLFFEEGEAARALELLDLAVEQHPACQPPRLAQLEMAFLMRDAPLFRSRARELLRLRPASPTWTEVARLGRALCPGETLFGVAQGPRAHEHYGAWPDMPNWINASWDLTAEVLAADFHRDLAAQPAAV
jgi:hypothetical protein